MKANAALVVLCLLPLIGCKPQQPTASTQSRVAPMHNSPIRRFENVSPSDGLGVALDTETGQWCRTWDWTYKGNAMRFDLNTLPLCKSLYDSNPGSGTDWFAQFGGKATH